MNKGIDKVNDIFISLNVLQIQSCTIDAKAWATANMP